MGESWKAGYGWISIALHWLGAIAMIASFITGEELEDAAGEARAQAYHLHLSWASILAVPLLLRVLWRLYDGSRSRRASIGYWNFCRTL